jgi:hypothetical protein
VNVEQSFAYHRTVTPMLWVFVALATGEMLLVHLFVTLRWPAIGWPLLALSLSSIVWLVFWIRSFRQRPHSLSKGQLELNTGSLRTLSVPISAIESVSTSWASGEHKGQGARNVVPLAYPNRLLRLSKPIQMRKGSYDRVAFRVDDPALFDAAMREVGIPVL